MLDQQVLSDDQNGQAGRGQVLLRSGVDNSEFAVVVFLAQEIGGHVSYQRDVGLRNLVVSVGRPHNSVVGRDVEVVVVLIKFSRDFRNSSVIVVLGASDDVNG